MTITKVTDAGLDRSRIVTPLIINGDMSVAQRSTSVTGVGDGDTGYHTLDRWRFSEGGDNSTVFTMSQDTNVPTGQGFAKSLKMDVTTADGSPGSSDSMFLQQRFEGQNLQLLKKGTSSAEKITVAFWVSSSKTGTYILELQDSDNTRNCSQSYTISSADTWEKKVVVFPADTTGAIDNDNANSFEVNWWLLAGTDFTSGTLATSFASRTNANRAVGQVNVGDNTSNNFYMTGCQMEIGEFDTNTIPDFPFESFENNLLKCQRYFETFPSNDGDGVIGFGYGSGSDTARTMFTFKVTKRATPTMSDSLSSSRQYRINFMNGSGTATNQNSTSTPGFGTVSTLNSGYMNLAGFSSIGGGLFGFLIYNNSTTLLSADAEL
tara:strand:- start:182 stop:1315 length:1134 start_codon:yes stop_codon:yes gene_type:complete